MPILAILLLAAATATPQLTPRGLYEATFRARIVAGNSLERFPQLEELRPYCVSRPRFTDVFFPAVNWTFLDADGKEVKRPAEGNSGLTLLSETERDFVLRFYAPEPAARVRIATYPNAKGNQTRIDGLTVRPIARGETLNVNPRFDLSPDALPGWQLTGGARYLPGIGVETTGGAVYSDLFPVEPGMRLTMSLKGHVSKDIDRHNRLSCMIRYLRNYADGAKRSAYVNSKKIPYLEGTRREFCEEQVVPEGVKWARCQAHGGLIYEIRITGEE